MKTLNIDDTTAELLNRICSVKGCNKVKLIRDVMRMLAKQFGIEQTPIPDKKLIVKNDDLVHIRINAQEKSNLQTMAAKAGVSVSEIIRRAIDKELGKPEIKDILPLAEKPAGALDNQKGAMRFNLSLTGREKQSIDVLMKKTNMPRNKVLLGVLRGVIYNEEQFVAGEVEALNGIKNKVSALGINLNQIAKKLNISMDNTDLVHAQMVEKLGGNVNILVEILKSKMLRYVTRWGHLA